MMRIITGKARGTHLLTLEGNETRPTTERAKEAIFSILYTEVEGRYVLDLFAGSGQLGLEAVSRGARHATLVDASRQAVSIIEKNVKKTHFEGDCTVICADVDGFLRSDRAQYDLVFLDPPYASKLTARALSLLVSCGRLAPGAVVVAETGEERDVFGEDAETAASLAAAFRVTKRVRYGKACVTFLCYPGGETK